MEALDVSRRGLIAGLGALVVAVEAPWSAAEASTQETTPGAARDSTTLNAYLSLSPDGAVTVVLPSSEMGQGITTSLAQCVAEELDANWSDVRFTFAPEGKAYRRPIGPQAMQVTGGSASVSHWREPLRRAGASARDMLVRAAAAEWGVEPSECATSGGVVRHPGGREAGYGALALAASRLSPPSKPRLKPPSEHRILGQSVPRNDLADKVTGKAQFGIDVRLPGMLRACPVACPVFGGRVKSVRDADARGMPGVRDVLVFEDFVAVVADTWWQAKRASEALDIDWDEGPDADLDTAAISRRFRQGLEADHAKVIVGSKDAIRRIDADAEALDAWYEVPYLDHAPMEPLNCTVHVQQDRCDVWTGTQVQTLAQNAAMKITGLSRDRVTIHTTLLGGGFGRRGQNDFVEQALRIGVRTRAPVQVVWTREEALQHGFYRPASAAHLRATVADGKLDALHIRLASDNILHNYVPGLLEGLGIVESFPCEGLRLGAHPYAFERYQLEMFDPGFEVPIGFWRSVGHSSNAFFLESFVDEIAGRLGVDPVELRRSLIAAEYPDFRVALDLAVEKAGWGKPQPGRFQGVAIHKCFGSVCAQVAEISMEGSVPRVHRVTAAVDCGPVVNPDIVRTQIMSGVLYGLSAAMGEEITLEKGRVVQTNFHDYPILRMSRAPEVDVHIVEDPSGPVGGIGEIGVPPIAPAVCNAIFAATGHRIRRLPILKALREVA